MAGNGLDMMGDYDTGYYPQTVKAEDYYDLIELPNGHHVPVPIAKRLIGEKIVERIPVSHKMRGQRFFYCTACDALQKRLSEEGIAFIATDSNGYSFFRCKTHKPYTEGENEAKESMLLRLILGGLYKTLRYVQAEG